MQRLEILRALSTSLEITRCIQSSFRREDDCYATESLLVIARSAADVVESANLRWQGSLAPHDDRHIPPM
jgi:hypothetical protein